MTLAESILHFCATHTKNTVWIAFSGGMDSHVLLDLCHQARTLGQINFAVIHVNHGLSPHAHAWSAHCRQICQQYQFPYFERQITLSPAAGESIEECARNARYQIFAEHMHKGDLLLTAHHQDDQAETFLLQLLRGAGPKGLASMPIIRNFADGSHGRPLLQLSRNALQEYAQQHQLHWVEDESNQNLDLTRNFIRREILMVLKKRWPNVEDVIARSAAHCAESQQLLEDAALARIDEFAGSRPDTLSVSRLLQESAAWQRLLLRVWIARRGAPLPDMNKLAAIQCSVLTAAQDRMPHVVWQGYEIRRFRDDLYVMRCQPADQVQGSWNWDMADDLYLEGVGTLSALAVQGCGLKVSTGSVTVRFRREGEIVDLPARGRLTLKNLFQEWGVPTWERSRIPLVFAGKKLVQVTGYFLDDRFAATGAEKGWDIRLERV